MKIAHSLNERGHDLYETPAVATHALLKAEKLPQILWEPACGPGAIVRVLREAGHQVLATDLIYHDSLDQDHGGRDFLLERELPKLADGNAVEAIVTNPPFKLAGEFVEHAMKLCPRLIMLLRLTFYESKRRNSILDGGQLARVHVFRNRLPMMHRADWDGPRVSNPTAFAWFVWDRHHAGPSIWDRISWTPTLDAGPACATAQFETPLERQETRAEVRRPLRGDL
ncbi:class I SAM-dependent methyltransferase [Bradyrhizobium barranii subsp. apii]|uniref:Class I SAM-dependent methyltransferase n=1 Tax=Bradyrhizobium barranii subsp. apii TaxID=2819348 RepID=A0A8T5VCX1_9BRAD|nr:class I SAM-dependent methyltransferase [Bradyrhizobium barranii]UPT91425.1 class I SAM-dependent methyltransferase [Bradyrhizobium barranii subsp. apii]